MTPEGCELLTLAEPQEDTVGALEMLADALDAREPGRKVVRVIPDLPAHAALNADSMGAIIARLMPDDAILSDNSLTAGMGLHHSLKAWPHP